jgi:hypothetical protein
MKFGFFISEIISEYIHAAYALNINGAKVLGETDGILTS